MSAIIVFWYHFKGTPSIGALQELRVQEHQLRAKLNATRSLDVAKVFADQLDKLSAYDQELELRYIDTLKSPETP